MPRVRYFHTADGWLHDEIKTEADEFSVPMETHETDLTTLYGVPVMGVEHDVNLPDPRIGPKVDAVEASPPSDQLRPKTLAQQVVESLLRDPEALAELQTLLKQ